MVRLVLDHVHLSRDRHEDFSRLAIAAEAPQAHVQPVRRRHSAVVVARFGELAAIDGNRSGEVALQVVREAEMVRDVRMQCADRHVARVRLAVGLDFVRLAAHELCRALEIRRRAIDLSDREVAMAAMPIQPRVVGIERDAARVDVDCFADATQIRQPPGEPDDRVGVRWRMLIGGASPRRAVSRSARASPRTAEVA